MWWTCSTTRCAIFNGVPVATKTRTISHAKSSRPFCRVPGLVQKVDCGENGFQLIHRGLAPTGLVDLAPCRAKTGWRRDLCLKIMVGLRASTHSATIKTNAPTNNTLDIFWQSNHDEIVHKNDHKNSRQRHTKSKGFFTGIVVIFFRCHAPGRMGKNPPAEQLSEAPSGSHSVIERRERHSLRAALPVLTRSRGETGQWRPIPSPPSRSDQHVV